MDPIKLYAIAQAWGPHSFALDPVSKLMQLDDYDFDLPENLIAQAPAERRESSRMLVVEREKGTFRDADFTEFPDLLRPADLLVLNNTLVFPARLYGQSETGASIELFLVRETGEDVWEALARPTRRLNAGKRIDIAANLTATVIEKLPDGKVLIKMSGDKPITDLIDKYGRTPLPHYIKRERAQADADRDRYQTVYAAKRGAIAAPTAGLHFTPEILDGIRALGTSIAEVTLHVGYGTFEPVRVDDLAQHRVLPERYEIDDEAAARLSARPPAGRVVAVGTTTTRALESNFAQFGQINAVTAEADLTITPGFGFRIVDALLTNFHLPRSSLLVLTSTFGGHELIMDAYRHAVREGYRFYSYGDCMLII